MEKVRFSCAVCPEREVCQAPCDWLLSQLPRPPALYRERTYGLWPESTLVCRLRPAPGGRLERFRGVLSAREWEALELVYAEGLSQREAAERIGCHRSTLRTHLRRALEKVLRLLSAEGCPLSRRAPCHPKSPLMEGR